jgi:RNA polymerase sigma-70 factor, ECF subfamily
VSRYTLLSAAELARECVVSGNAAAWQEFIRRFHPLVALVVFRTAQHWGQPSAQLVDDLVQDTYLRVCEDDCRMLRNFQPRHPDAIYGLLKTVAANIVHDYFKSSLASKRGAGQIDSMDEDSSHQARFSARTVYDAVERHILLNQVDEILVRCEGDDRERNRLIFWLHYRVGLTAREIAAIPSIGMSTKGVETTLRRTTEMIREYVIPAREGFKRVKSL